VCIKTCPISTLDVFLPFASSPRSIGFQTILNIKYGQNKSINKSPSGLFREFGLWGGNPVKIGGDLVKNSFTRPSRF